uniref:Uncharacterized protein n=1 Tax=Arundo donax TaxID=35708 RepID=A0A0A9TAB8_ARUDO
MVYLSISQRTKASIYTLTLHDPFGWSNSRKMGSIDAHINRLSDAFHMFFLMVQV